MKKAAKNKREVTLEGYYALLCNCGRDGFKSALVCGIYSSKKEAQEVAKEIKDCSTGTSAHRIVRCTADVTYTL